MKNSNKLFFDNIFSLLFSILFVFSVSTVFAYPGEGTKSVSTPNATKNQAVIDAANKAKGVLYTNPKVTQPAIDNKTILLKEKGRLPQVESGIPTNCTTWYDGCNTCSVKDGKLLGCTQRFCAQNGVAECKNPPSSKKLFSPIALWSSDFSPAKEWSLNYPRTTGDVNGDGKSDIVGFGKDGVYVSLSTGTGFSPIALWSSDFSPAKDWSTNFPRMTADVNSDGKSDLVGFGRDGIYIALSTGTGFSPVALWSSDFTTSNEWNINYPRMTADINGDGKSDIVGFGKDGVYVSLSLDNSSSAKVPVRVYPTVNNTDTTTPPSTLKGDLNGDNVVDVFDYNLLVADFGKKI